jgi:hypothetical protein
MQQVVLGGQSVFMGTMFGSAGLVVSNSESCDGDQGRRQVTPRYM